MNLFIKKNFIFLLGLVLIPLLGLILPPTPYSKYSLLHGKNLKDSLLINITETPRLILVGGSNVSFGINSYLLKDSLPYHPINVAINAGIGLDYILHSVKNYVRKDDIVVLMFEYDHFFDKFMYGYEAMFRTAIEIDNNNALPYFFKYGGYKFIPKIAMSRYNILEYRSTKMLGNTQYGVNSFNEFGDVKNDLKITSDFSASTTYGKFFNTASIHRIKSFIEVINKQGAMCVISYPSIYELSYTNCKQQILEVDSILRNEFRDIVISEPFNYTFNKNMMLDASYHLNEKGAILRTKHLIKDIRAYLYIHK